MTESNITMKKCSNPGCSYKGEDQPVANFYRHQNKRHGLDSWCKTCKNISWQKHQKIAHRICEESRAKAGKCEKCGKVPERIEHLQFAHHTRAHKHHTKSGKARGIWNLASVAAVERELPKGKWCCAECADKDTQRENEEKKSMNNKAHHLAWKISFWRKFVELEKTSRGRCCDCGKLVTSENLRIFEFDHRDPRTKIDSIAHLVMQMRPFRVIKAEMAKCDLRCQDCHRARSKKEGHHRKKHKSQSSAAMNKTDKWRQMTAYLLLNQLGPTKGYYTFARTIAPFESWPMASTPTSAAASAATMTTSTVMTTASESAT